MLLMFAIRFFFCNSELIKSEQIINYGQKLCILFVKQYPKLYKTNIVYNIHSLIHLGDDVRNFVILVSISAFPYENMTGMIKKHVRSSHLPLKQLINGVNEGSFSAVFSASHFVTKKGKIGNGSRFINSKVKDSCVILKCGDIGQIIPSVKTF